MQEVCTGLERMGLCEEQTASRWLGPQGCGILAMLKYFYTG